MTTLAGQTYAFLMTILAGGIVGFLFDIYRVMRKAMRPRPLATALTDLLYWIVVTPTVFAMLLAGNWGELRFYVLIGLVLGLVLYFQILSALVIWSLIGLLTAASRSMAFAFSGAARLVAFPFVAFRELIGGVGSRRAKGAGLGRPAWIRRPRPNLRMAWQRVSLSRFFGRIAR